ncbi:MAG: hypothetical protein JW885_08995 [Deltaproteobacteria bacterium]|nr:hypothetical protein [Candidatus Zymogenaceae bacterium]
MKILLNSEAGRREIDMAITHTLDDLAKRIQGVYSVSDVEYLYDFGDRTYSFNGGFDASVHHCDLLLYTDVPVIYRSGDLVVRVYHENTSDNIYDYCDFDHPHYCSVYEEMIDIDSCYESMMCLNGFFRIESSEKLMKIADIDTAREKCRRCIYTNCDGIHHEKTLKNLSLTNMKPSKTSYRVHPTHASPDKIDTVGNAFFRKNPESEDREE